MPHTLIHSPKLNLEDGQTITETAVILALVVLVVMVGMMIFSSALGALWSQLAQTLPSG